MAGEFSFNIVEKIGVLSENGKGWTTELNFVSWGDYAPKYDIRSWDSNHEKMGKGVTLKKEELKKLREILNSMNLD